MNLELDFDTHDYEAVLERLRKRYHYGDKFALLQALKYCLRAKLIAPQWVVTAYAISLKKWEALLVPDLGAAFGVGKHQRSQIAKERKRRRLAMAVYETVRMIIDYEQNPVTGAKYVLDDSVFELVGKRLRKKGISKTLARKYYLETCEAERVLSAAEPDGTRDTPPRSRAEAYAEAPPNSR
jgi:hypothetical protein